MKKEKYLFFYLFLFLLMTAGGVRMADVFS